MTPSNPSNFPPLEWVFQHFQVIGWPAIVIAAWKVAAAFQKFIDRIEKTTGQIDNMASNHFPHMEASLTKQDGLLTTMDASLKEIVANTGRHRHTDYPDGNHI